MKKILLAALLACVSVTAFAQANRIDIIRHDAPDLADYGRHDIGVRTLEFNGPDSPDILNIQPGGDAMFYDRRLTVEIWYPALLEEDEQPGGRYTTTTRNPEITATLYGRAVRDAAASENNGVMPLIIISHGYPGNRYLMSHLGENLASKGYIVASIDHRDSTYTDQKAISSTLYNRPLDQLFVLDQIEKLSNNSGSFLNGIVDTDRTGIVGYSMGGYGLIINLGGGYSDMAAESEYAPPNDFAYRHAASNPDSQSALDPRIKAGFAVAPWGMAAGVWNPGDLARIETPTFYLAGSKDATAGYENGIRKIFENATNSDRYLLTYLNAGHNAGAPMPLPTEISESENQTGAFHYTDPVWDTVRMNNIMGHFATAFFDTHLKQDSEAKSYLDVVPRAQDGVYAIADDQPTDSHTYWKGFSEGTARGLMLEYLGPSE